MADYVKTYLETVGLYRRQNSGKDRGKLQRHHVWPVSLGGPNAGSNYVDVTAAQHRRLHTILNLALLQSGNPDKVVELDYHKMEESEEMDVSVFRNSRITLEKRGVKLSLSLAKAADLCRMLHPVPDTGNPPRAGATRWRVLMAAAFGNKLYGFRMSLKLHRRKDMSLFDELKAMTEKTDA